MITGGGTAATVYRALAGISPDWSGIDVLFSDERCVHPHHEASNFGMARDTLLDRVNPRAVHRIRGEDEPEKAAADYDAEITPFVERGIDLTILGMGADCHICALFPGSAALDERERLAVPVDRPDGLKGITMTLPALMASRRVVVIVSGDSKADAVSQTIERTVATSSCPIRVLASLKNLLLVDEQAGQLLRRNELAPIRRKFS